MPQRLSIPRDHSALAAVSSPTRPSLSTGQDNSGAETQNNVAAGFGHSFGSFPIFSKNAVGTVQRDGDPDDEAQGMSLDPNAPGGQCIDPNAGGSSSASTPAPAPAPSMDTGAGGSGGGSGSGATMDTGAGGSGGGSGSGSMNDGTEGSPSAAPVNTPAGDDNVSIPQLPGPVNDAVGVGLGVAGMVPGPVGTAATLLGGAQTLTQSTPNPNDASYHDDQTMQGVNLGLGAASLLGVEAAGPLGLVAAAGGMLGHGAQALGNSMIEGGAQSNPGQFGPDPMDNM